MGEIRLKAKALSLMLFSRRWLCHETTTVPEARKQGGGRDIRNRYIKE